MKKKPTDERLVLALRGGTHLERKMSHAMPWAPKKSKKLKKVQKRL
jgi:hypothetical protein